MAAPSDDERDGPSGSDDGEPEPSESAASTSPERSPFDTVTDYLGTGDQVTFRLVAVVTVLALVARLVLLGDRVQHFDEGRVAWWTLEFMRTGDFHYRFIIHGPFVQHVTTWLFSVFGVSDYVTRLVPALVGGLLPAAALLFRDRLRRSEVVAMALFLGANPILLYYSRFFRSTILVAAFSFVAFGLFVRAFDAHNARSRTDAAVATDGGEPAVDASAGEASAGTSDGLLSGLFDGDYLPTAVYVHLAVVFVALAFTAKENAVVYVLCWIGASALIADRLLSTTTDGASGFDRAEAALGRVLVNPAPYVGHLLLAAVLFLLVIVFFYAPRGGGGPNGVGLFGALLQPGELGAVLNAMVEDIQRGLDHWFGGTTNPKCRKDNVIDGYICTLGRFAETMALYAAPLVGLAVVGFIIDRYSGTAPRPLVMFASYWGFVSILGYPLGTDIYGSWITVNALVPLTVPAAVGLAVVYRAGVNAFADGDGLSVVLVVFLLLLVAGQTGYQATTGVYVEPEEDHDALVQYAQPGGEWRPVVDDMNRIAASNQGTDVLVYGSYYVDGAESAPRTPACMKWFKSLPLPWYMDKEGMAVDCATSEGALADRETMPPVVIARASAQSTLDSRLGDGYSKTRAEMRRGAIDTVIYVRQGA